jgi:hypothetical protein
MELARVSQYKRSVNPYHFTLSNKLTGIELGDDTLQDLVDNRGQHSLVIVGSEFSVAASKYEHRSILVTLELTLSGDRQRRDVRGLDR